MFVLNRNLNGQPLLLMNGKQPKYFDTHDEAEEFAQKLNAMLLPEIDPSNHWVVKAKK